MFCIPCIIFMAMWNHVYGVYGCEGMFRGWLNCSKHIVRVLVINVLFSSSFVLTISFLTSSEYEMPAMKVFIGCMIATLSQVCCKSYVLIVYTYVAMHTLTQTRHLQYCETCCNVKGVAHHRMVDLAIKLTLCLRVKLLEAVVCTSIACEFASFLGSGVTAPLWNTTWPPPNISWLPQPCTGARETHSSREKQQFVCCNLE